MTPSSEIFDDFLVMLFLLLALVVAIPWFVGAVAIVKWLWRMV